MCATRCSPQIGGSVGELAQVPHYLGGITPPGGYLHRRCSSRGFVRADVLARQRYVAVASGAAVAKGPMGYTLTHDTHVGMWKCVLSLSFLFYQFAKIFVSEKWQPIRRGSELPPFVLFHRLAHPLVD